MNPFEMWVRQTPRQIYELLKTYADLHKEVNDASTVNKDYTVKRDVKIPDWYTVPKGALVYSADDVTQEEISIL